VLALAVVLVLALGVWLWLRDSSLVAVQRVTVTGVSGPDAGRIRSALTRAARNMTTLDVKMDELHTAVVPYPVVKSLSVSTQFPHGMRIRVTEEIPVAEVAVGSRSVAVASDGTLLHDARPGSQLPMIAVGAAPGGTRLTDGGALQVVALLAAAPSQLLSHLSQASTTSAHGLVAQLRNGPSIYFGDLSRLAAKWIAASAVLASHGSDGAEYIDVSDPERPVAGASSAGTSGSSTSVVTGATASSAPAGAPTATTPAAGAGAAPTPSSGG
jgi:cell division protein FtsQ